MCCEQRGFREGLIMSSGICCEKQTVQPWSYPFLICQSGKSTPGSKPLHGTRWILCQSLSECVPCLFISCCLSNSLLLPASGICALLSESSFQNALANIWAMGGLCVVPLCNAELEAVWIPSIPVVTPQISLWAFNQLVCFCGPVFHLSEVLWSLTWNHVLHIFRDIPLHPSVKYCIFLQRLTTSFVCYFLFYMRVYVHICLHICLCI